ncbi:YciI family protein [uncultured Lacinutrix sp.]|uniref:YciI family protein n=1 Tax=uncultured Lacinutrix sp. TaxID=574032 RepID=UPI0026273890|nr:YciI family protein [uncultured Lacinutrix sp.]
MKKTLLFLLIILSACKTETKEVLVEEGIVNQQSSKKTLEDLKTNHFEVFDYVDEKTKDTVIMQKYFIAFLKSGANTSQNKEETEKLQKEHLAHLGKMYDLGYADISGPFGDDGAIRGITIYNVPTLKMADSLANSDPMVKAGRLEIEIHSWWAAKGYGLR